jgi:hypothetical protein
LVSHLSCHIHKEKGRSTEDWLPIALDIKHSIGDMSQ